MVRKRSRLSKPSTPICTRCGRLMELRLVQLELTPRGIKAGEWYCPRCDAAPRQFPGERLPTPRPVAPPETRPCSVSEWQEGAEGARQDAAEGRS
jgi:hypothetical protein